jgi:hypothetical protein
MSSLYGIYTYFCLKGIIQNSFPARFQVVHEAMLKK